MRRASVIRIVILVAGISLGLAREIGPAAAALPVDDHGSLAATRVALDTSDILVKPHGWVEFDEVCALSSTFAVTLNRAKQGSGRVIVRDFKGMAGQSLPPSFSRSLGFGLRALQRWIRLIGRDSDRGQSSLNPIFRT